MQYGQVYDVYSSEVGGHAQLVLSTSTDDGKTWHTNTATGLNEAATDEEFFPAYWPGKDFLPMPALRKRPGLGTT